MSLVSLEITEIDNSLENHKKELQRARQHRYYERNAERIQERRKERYDAEQQSAYYQANRERIRSQHRHTYHQKRRELNVSRLTHLLSMCSKDLQNTIQKMIDGVKEGVVNDRDVLAMEKAVILTTVLSNQIVDDGNLQWVRTDEYVIKFRRFLEVKVSFRKNLL